MSYLVTHWQYFLIAITCYIWGSVPYGYLLTKLATGKNILNVGSGNIGSTNVRRVAGRKVSVITQLLDMIKGLAPVGIYLYLLSCRYTTTDYNLVYLIALASILGHNFSIFLRFKGGKGVNTTLGATLLIAPYSVLIAVFSFFVIKALLKYVSAGSLTLAIMLPFSELILYGYSYTFYYLLICSILIILMHTSNIKRLINGNESL